MGPQGERGNPFRSIAPRACGRGPCADLAPCDRYASGEPRGEPSTGRASRGEFSPRDHVRPRAQERSFCRVRRRQEGAGGGALLQEQVLGSAPRQPPPDTSGGSRATAATGSTPLGGEAPLRQPLRRVQGRCLAEARSPPGAGKGVLA